MTAAIGRETIDRLADRIRQMEASFRPAAPAAIPLGATGLEELFPRKRLPVGALVELVASAEGAGAWTLALMLAHYACGDRKLLLVADPQRSFYPPAALKLGLERERTVVVRSANPRDALLAVGQALRCPAVGAAVGLFERLGEREVRRLQLAAESGEAVGVLLRPLAARNAPSFATVRLLLSPLPSLTTARRVRVETLRYRGGPDGRIAVMEIDDDTGHVRVFSQLAAATDSPRGPIYGINRVTPPTNSTLADRLADITA